MDEIKELINASVEANLNRILYEEMTEEESEMIVSELKTLHELRVNEQNLQANLEAEEIKRKEENRKFIISTSVDLVKTLLPLGVFAIYTEKGFKFEESGVWTSNMLRSLLNKMKIIK